MSMKKKQENNCRVSVTVLELEERERIESDTKFLSKLLSSLKQTHDLSLCPKTGKLLIREHSYG